MYIADTLSRAYMKTTEGAHSEPCEIRAIETVDHEEHVRVDTPNEMCSGSK